MKFEKCLNEKTMLNESDKFEVIVYDHNNKEVDRIIRSFTYRGDMRRKRAIAKYKGQEYVANYSSSRDIYYINLREF